VSFPSRGRIEFRDGKTKLHADPITADRRMALLASKKKAVRA
jgi:hypothetical protein